MLKHRGKSRTYSHNLKLASLLSTVAGIVNSTGVLALGTLTTNVTGHFAYFSEGLFFKNYRTAAVYLCYILSFLFGAFVSSLSMEWGNRYTPRLSYTIPISIETALLFIIGLSAYLFPIPYTSFAIPIACLLLFSMGLQNALVTSVSNTVVRTTHLTGLFTDLGIEVSHLMFKTEREHRLRLYRSIFLKLMIISGFFCGGLLGALTYDQLGIATLLFPVGILLVALWYDRLRFSYYQFKRKTRRIRR